MVTSSEVALQVVQQAIATLINWADPNHQLPSEFNSADEYLAVTKAKEILGWRKNTNVNTLHLLFDKVKLCQDNKQNELRQHYHPLMAIANENNQYPNIPYPLDKEPTQEQKDNFKQQIKEEVLPCLNLSKNWQNLSLLTLIIEKFGSCLSFGESDVALVDITRATGSVASALANNPETTDINLIAGDLSGIQKFIYTISSDGALKSLRARSFYLELVTEEVLQQLLEVLELPRISVIYAGGGKFYLLAATEEIKQKIKQVQQELNKWLGEEFQNKIFLALDSLDFPVNAVSNEHFAKYWEQIVQLLNQQKNHKFSEQINDLLKIRTSYGDRCRVCHRDDTTDLDLLNTEEDDSVLACLNCRKMFQLGSQLFKTKAVVRSRRQEVSSQSDKIYLLNNFNYFLFDKVPTQSIQDDETLFLINNWNIKEYYSPNAVALLLGNYGKESCENPGNFIRTHELAKKATGIKRVGYLRMDIDNLGKIFAKGLKNNHTLPRLAGLSRQMSYFFKAYLNSLAKNRASNLPDKAKYLTSDADGIAAPRSNLLFIYAGGDDLFVSGSWNEVVEFSFDVYQSFRAYTGHNPDITLSGGVSINDVKYPLYQAANNSGKAEDSAKSKGRDSLGLFGQVFKWDNWLGNELIDHKTKAYLSPEVIPDLLGVLPFVKQLQKYKQLTNDYSRSFVRNLLITDQLQEQIIQEKQRIIDEIKSKQLVQTQENDVVMKLEAEQKEVCYFLHLPKIAYTLARLPSSVRDSSDFEPIRKSLKSSYNAPYFRSIATWIELLTRSQHI